MALHFRDKSIVIALHESTSGPGHDLRDFLLERRVKEAFFISHPLLYIPENFKNSSRYELYKKGSFVKTHTAYHWKFPEYLLYIKDTLYTIIWCFLNKKKYDYFFGLGDLNTFAGLLLKKIGLVDKVIYYVIDYVPQRFSNSVVNQLYHIIEKYCAQNADWTWNLSPRMITAREKKWKKKFPHQLVVPHGVHFKRIKRVPFDKIRKKEILYMGALLKKQGIQLLLSVLPTLIKKHHDIRLTIIGKGPYEHDLRALVHKLKVEEHVSFLGYIPSHAELENTIAKSAITIALYDKKFDTFSYYADPGKIKNYLGAGVPVVMTNVPYVAKMVEKAECGFVIEYKQKELEEVLNDFFSNETKMRQYRINAVKFAKQYDWDSVFSKALEYLN